ncbi:MAG: epoxyqueuosine reductase [candidate division Zixibacteria bacterium]
MNLAQVKNNLRDLVMELGASAFGICEFGDLVENFHPEIRDKAKKLPFAISIGVSLRKAVMDTLVDRPNDIYKSHYRTANAVMDNITFHLAKRIAEMDRSAIPIPASMIVTRYPLLAHVNHREIAWKAGLGWRGKNNLLINPRYGGRIRLTTILTDLELEPDEIIENDCGDCKACIKKCPAGAIGDSVDNFSLEKCQEQVVYFSKQNNFGQLICGLCLNFCPHAQKSE